MLVQSPHAIMEKGCRLGWSHLVPAAGLQDIDHLDIATSMNSSACMLVFGTGLLS